MKRTKPFDPPCEQGFGCQFIGICGKTSDECGEYYQSLADKVVDAAIDEAMMRKKGLDT